MRTTLDVDKQLIDEIVALTGEHNKGKAVNKALSDYVRQKRLKTLLASKGKFPLDLDDWREFRHVERA